MRGGRGNRRAIRNQKGKVIKFMIVKEEFVHDFIFLKDAIWVFRLYWLYFKEPCSNII